MTRGTKEQCQEKLDRYNTAKSEYDAFQDDAIAYKAIFDAQVEQMNTVDIPAKNAKREQIDAKAQEIRDILGGMSVSEIQAASARIGQIDVELTTINARIIQIMTLLDGQAEPSEVHNLLSEGNRLAGERTNLENEREGLVDAVNTYNENQAAATSLEGELRALEAEMTAIETNLETAETEAKENIDYYEEAFGHADHRKYLMEQIESEWNEYECEAHLGSLPGYEDQSAMDEDDVPRDEGEEIDTGDIEIPEEIDEPDDVEEGEDWDPPDVEDSGI